VNPCKTPQETQIQEIETPPETKNKDIKKNDKEDVL
jgi:hypothetical protein